MEMTQQDIRKLLNQFFDSVLSYLEQGQLETEIIKPPTITELEPPTAIPEQLEQEKPVLIELLESLQRQEEIQKKLHLLDSQLLENVEKFEFE